MKAFLIIIALLSGGCATWNTRLEQQLATLSSAGRPPAYLDGFRGGWNSGQYAAGNPFVKASKNQTAYESNIEYRRGWDDGVVEGQADYKKLKLGW